MTDLVFVDTNVFVYARDASEPEKQAVASEWLARLWSLRNGRVSVQVLQAYYITVTHKLKPGLDLAIARQDVRSLASWRPVTPDVALLEEAWALQDRMSLSWWDGLILAAARAAGASYLLSEDMQAGRSIGGLSIVNPFTTDVDTLFPAAGP